MADPEHALQVDEDDATDGDSSLGEVSSFESQSALRDHII